MPIPKLSDYKKIVGEQKLREIRREAKSLGKPHLVHINATSMGGGVSEILNTLVFLMNDAGIPTGWRTLVGSQSFFKITKGIHNGLQGKDGDFNAARKKVYLEYCDRNSIINHVLDHDAVVIHDPQPLGMIKNYHQRCRWVWRCHIDLSSPNRQVLRSLLPYIRMYDQLVFSKESFTIPGVRKPQRIIPPSIDPLSRKNKPLSSSRAKLILQEHGIDPDVPILAQVSRFDPWKDHMGVVEMYREIRKKHRCQLVLMGSMASDDPEGPLIFMDIRKKIKNMRGVTLITEENDLLVNALQREAKVVFQNSIREGFALTVSEAMWKGTPVIGTPVGGIPLQILHGRTGYLIYNKEEGAEYASRLLRDEDLRKELGRKGRQHVKENFLITRHLHDYVRLTKDLMENPCHCD